MREFSLRFLDGSSNPDNTITFESEDAHEAFSIMDREKLRGPAELYDGQRSLGMITHKADGGWILESHENA